MLISVLFVKNILCLLFRPYWRCYYSNTDAIIYVVDSADRDRIGISKDELIYMLRVSDIFVTDKIFIFYFDKKPYLRFELIRMSLKIHLGIFYFSIMTTQPCI